MEVEEGWDRQMSQDHGRLVELRCSETRASGHAQFVIFQGFASWIREALRVVFGVKKHRLEQWNSSVRVVVALELLETRESWSYLLVVKAEVTG